MWRSQHVRVGRGEEETEDGKNNRMKNEKEEFREYDEEREDDKGREKKVETDTLQEVRR